MQDEFEYMFTRFLEKRRETRLSSNTKTLAG